MDAIGGPDKSRLPGVSPAKGQEVAPGFGQEINRLMEEANQEFEKPNRAGALGHMQSALNLARQNPNDLLLRQTWQSVANIVTGQKNEASDPTPTPTPSPSPKGGDPNPKGGDPSPKG